MNAVAYKLCPLHMFAYILILIGAINWGLVGIGWFV